MKKRNSNKTKQYISGSIFFFILLLVIIIIIQYQIQLYKQLYNAREEYLYEHSTAMLLTISHLVTYSPSVSEMPIRERLKILYPEKFQPSLEKYEHIILLGWKEEDQIMIFYDHDISEEMFLQVMQQNHEMYRPKVLFLQEGELILFSKYVPDICVLTFLPPLLLPLIFFFFLLYFTQKFWRTAPSKSSSTRYLIAGLSHELKNPLNAMNLNIQLLEENFQELQSSEKEALQENLNLIKKQFISLSNLINRFLEYSRTKQLVYTNVDIYKCIEEVLNNIPWTKKKPHVKVNIQTIGKNKLLRSDAQILHQIFQNVLINAFEAFPEDQTEPTVLIKIEFLTKYVKIRFIDNGPGMDQETLSHLGEPFFTTRENGAGLGLPIVFHLVDHLKGDIQIFSELNNGTEIIITLTYE